VSSQVTKVNITHVLLLSMLLLEAQILGDFYASLPAGSSVSLADLGNIECLSAVGATYILLEN